MALQRQGPGARRQTRPNMCTAAMAGPTTFPCHGEGELPGRPVANLRSLILHGTVHHAVGETHARGHRSSGILGHPQQPSITRQSSPLALPHPQNPRSEVANLGEIKPKSGAREWSRV